MIICNACGMQRESSAAKSGKPRIPRSWKELAGSIYCRKCKTEHYALRAISLPVAACDWETVRPLLRAAWRDTVRCSNWLLTQYYQRDQIAAAVAVEKLPPWQLPYLYPEARGAFPDLEPTTLVAIINSVSQKYRAARFDLWRGAASLPTYRSAPYPVNAQTWKLEHAPDNEWRFSFRAGASWHTLILRRDAEFYRQHAALSRVVSGEAEAGEAALYESGKQIMLKIAGWFPRSENKLARGTVHARTAAEAFLIAANGEQLWRLNADHVQRWIVGSQAQQQRLREDLKVERRFPKQMRHGIEQRMQFISEQRKRRLDSWMHEASAQLINWTGRQHAAQLIWDDSYRSMMPSFPWFVFAARIEEKCRMAGIEFIRASAGVMLHQPGALAGNGSI